MRVFRLLTTITLLAVALCAVATSGAAQQSGDPDGPVRVIEVSGDIDVVAADWITGRIASAEDAGAAVVVIQLDTPGGLVSATDDIVRSIQNARVPVAVWVGPSGARAASAGAFIAASARYVLMAPGTNIGSATPVSGSGGDLDAKVVNDAAASIAALAESTGHNADAYRSMVTDAANLTAGEAVDADVADATASTLDEAVAWLDGRPGLDGATIVTAGASVHVDTLPWYLQVLQILTNPNLVFLLLLIGLVGLMIEVVAPGGIVPGAVGLIAVLLGVAGMSALPFNWIGVALLVVGVGLLFAETQVPGFGALAGAGIVALCLGGAFLFGGSDDIGTSLWIVIPAGVLVGAGGAVAGRRVVKAHRAVPVTGDAVLQGHEGTARSAVDASGGRVMVNGELWAARAAAGGDIDDGAAIRVVRVDTDDLVLIVEPRTAKEA